jgi:dipeptidyl aminopeptidase/acylaminoacyl peptidase
MKSCRLLLAPLLSLAAVAAAQQPPPPSAFAALPAMKSPAISPDGKRYAFIAHVGERVLVYAAQLDNNQADAVINVLNADARALTWANNDTLILLASEAITVRFAARMTESFAPFGIDLTGDLSIRQLGGARPVGGGYFVRGRRLIGFERSTGRVLVPIGGALYSVDAKNGDVDERDEASGFNRDWVVDENGEPQYRVQYREKTDYFQILRRADRGLWQTLGAQNMALPEVDIHGLDAEGELIVGVRPTEGGRYGLYKLSSDGKLGQVVYSHPTLDVAEVRIDPYTNRVVGAAVEGERPVWFDEDLTKHQAQLDEAFPNESPWIVDWSEDRSRLIVSTERSDRAPVFYYYDAKDLMAKALASTYPVLDDSKLAPRLPYTYKARDGVEIPGFLTRPLGVDGPAPLVLLPHGGPADVDVDGFDWLAHFLASRGYAVLQPNFRGSGGYGRAWEDAGHGGWGIGVMQHDLTDGVAAAVAAGIADPERVCIVGSSYGGYAALAGATFTPELYRCAVSINGVSDLRDIFTLYRGRRDGRTAAVTYFEQSLGVGDGSPRPLDAASPAKHAERVQADVLLIHGRDDSVVLIGQSRKMERALRDAGKNVQFVELDGEDHWLSEADTRLETLEALDTFLAQHLGSR